ncbi:MAG: undecaprenyl-diphosphate phosphatase [Spirochaetota bacterium]
MTLFQSILLGVLQGTAEFLPVSSSGHLALLKSIMRLSDVPILFDILLHISTLCVVVIVFRVRVAGLLTACFRFMAGKTRTEDSENLKLVPVIIVATLCTAVIGYGISKLELEQYPKVVSALLIVTGVILLLTIRTSGNKDYSKTGLREGILTGIAQGIGVFPGISRSGITISAALFSGMAREKAGEFSFLISIPAILGAFLLKLKDAGRLLTMVNPGVLAAGIIAAFIIGLISLILLMRIIRSGKLFFFSMYLIPIGIAGVIFL